MEERQKNHGARVKQCDAYTLIRYAVKDFISMQDGDYGQWHRIARVAGDESSSKVSQPSLTCGSLNSDLSSRINKTSA